jgi:hypothetical protein
MKKLFYAGLFGLSLFEILNVYFIMPMPGSQRMESIDLAYFLYNYRWMFRTVFLILIIFGSFAAIKSKVKWLPMLVAGLTIVIVYLFNFRFSADKMFLQPNQVTMKSKDVNKVPEDRLVIGLENNGEAKAYPIAFIAYHHQVQDTVGGKPVIVTYCSVCRTGRVFEPLVNGQPETFRLVGMDHFNAMLEDATTQSWWRQVNGEAIVGELTGLLLPEVQSYQTTVDKWFELFPEGLVMQADPLFADKYDSLAKYEKGLSSGTLTRTDSLAWQDKSWVVGIEMGENSKAYDWNELKTKRVINDVVGEKLVVVALAIDGQSFAAFERPSLAHFTIDDKDQLIADSMSFDFSGKNLTNGKSLNRIKASQEFWHSWLTFHPRTER